MITSSRKAAFATKQEENPNDGKISKPSSSSTSWSRSKDPRIVRVSRAFGGKDRHSKVCTVRGLRDRRVRLSVPTAIQLYDLQDRLGLNQPSKVVDWLINAAKHDIDQLPPLQMPPGNFGQFHQPLLINPSQSDKGGPKNNYWISDIKSKEVARERIDEKGKQSDVEGHGAYISSNNFFTRINHPSLPGLLNQQTSSFLRWDPNSDLSLSNFGTHGLAPEAQDLHGFNVVQPLPFPSNLSMPFPTATTTQSYFPSYVNASGEFDPKQINFQMLSSTSQNPLYSISQTMRPFQLSMTPPKLFPSRNDSGSEQNKDN